MRAKQWKADEDSDWILLDENDFEDCEQEQITRPEIVSSPTDTKRPEKGNNLRDSTKGSSFLFFGAKTKQQLNEVDRRKQTVMEANEIELIRASWIPARKDPTGSGVLLFKSLFTKFPDYLKLFSQFVDLDIGNLHENRRLIKHAVKVIDTVTFVVDSIGDASKADQLNEALINLVRSHLKRRIGLEEFRNLGIVLIDFICDLHQRRGSPPRPRTSSPCENASLESMASSEIEAQDDSYSRCQNYSNNSYSNLNNRYVGAESMFVSHTDSLTTPPPTTNSTALNTNLLVAAWTKLYASILDLVKIEENRNE